MKKLFIVIGFTLVWSACQKDQKLTTSVPANTTPAPITVPPGYPQPNIPSDNPQTVEGIDLGRHLFYDKRLSGDNSQACASCHLQEYNFADFRRFSEGIDGVFGDRNAMAIVDLAWQDFFFWDGREGSLEAQAIQPVINPIEMHTTWPEVIAKLAQDSLYQVKFKMAFGDNSITKENAAKAISQFERSMVSGNSKFDNGLAMVGDVLIPFPNFSQEENLGKDLFFTEDGDCFHCHANPTFGAFGELQFSNNGLDSVLQVGSGREAITNDTNDRAKFKIPTLRNIEYSFPYMHDGRFSNLQQVIEFYNTGGFVTPTTDPNMKKAGIGRNWTPQQKAALLAFLQTLSDESFLLNPDYSDPF